MVANRLLPGCRFAHPGDGHRIERYFSGHPTILYRCSLDGSVAFCDLDSTMVEYVMVT
jgi:hypothetical protein